MEINVCYLQNKVDLYNIKRRDNVKQLKIKEL
uniref:Uncharacterized protein n=1 Tax=Siphoviridae sp. ct3r22 TaxID=2825325 RepID=A0A8S5V132_9CAUD|nr:MAG TPA: hypothetical protein [Siphoviridae sp. ct3r22]